MTIISIDKINGIHRIEQQSGRQTVWLDGYAEVPQELERAAFESLGYCEIEIAGSKVIRLTPTEKPPAEPPPEPQTDDIYTELAKAIRQGVNSI